MLQWSVTVYNCKQRMTVFLTKNTLLTGIYVALYSQHKRIGFIFPQRFSNAEKYIWVISCHDNDCGGVCVVCWQIVPQVRTYVAVPLLFIFMYQYKMYFDIHRLRYKNKPVLNLQL